MKQIKLTVLLCALLPLQLIWAEAPAGYYSALENQSGTGLWTAIFNTIKSHTNVGYDGLYNVYPTSDLTGSNGVWDMYSTCTWTQGQKKCGSYSKVCDCYNREHSVPQSWFNEAQPMKSDAFHVYPTDGKVNGQRSNYPYGECSGGTNLGGKALGRLGTSTFSGYTNVGTVFEPDNQYKGDFARSYFYMVTCYYDKNFTQASEGTKVFTYSGGRAGFTPYAIALFMKWSREDPVSQKEIDRNDAVYAKQRNRNPFIDLPGLEEYLWGNKQGQSYSSQSTDLEEVEDPVLRVLTDGGVVRAQTWGAQALRVQVYSTDGRLVGQGTEVNLPGKGVYVIRTNNQSTRIVY